MVSDDMGTYAKKKYFMRVYICRYQFWNDIYANLNIWDIYIYIKPLEISIFLNAFQATYLICYTSPKLNCWEDYDYA